jgi:hypothetical protein
VNVLHFGEITGLTGVEGNLSSLVVDSRSELEEAQTKGKIHCAVALAKVCSGKALGPLHF